MLWTADTLMYNNISMDAAYSGDTLIWKKKRNTDYLTFTVVSGGTIGWGYNTDYGGSPKTIYYKKNNGQWTSLTPAPYDYIRLTGGTFINVSTGDVVRFKGTHSRYCDYSVSGIGVGSFFIPSTAKCNLSGDILSMTYGDDYANNWSTGLDFSLAYLFYGNRGIDDASQLKLPATDLSKACYSAMFFASRITKAPSILPAKNLVSECYSNMFQNCINLTSAPVLPATALTSMCYSGMFYHCPSLQTAPDLPAKTLKSYCYDEMFAACTSLNYVKCLATDISTYACTRDWMKDVGSSGTFVKASTMTGWTTGPDGIPANWTVQNT